MILNFIKLFSPLLVQPFVAENYGVNGFSIYVYMISMIPFLSIIFDYGFAYSSVRKISRIKEGAERYKYFKVITVAKLVNSIVCIPILMLLMSLSNIELGLIHFFTSILLVLSFSLSPAWFFQSIDKLDLATFVEVIFIVISILIIYLVIAPKFDVVIVIWAQIICRILSYVYLYLYSLKLLKNRDVDCSISFSYFKEVYREGFGIFSFRVLTSVYVSGFPMLLSMILSPSVFAIFMAAERIFRAGQGVLNPVSQILFAKSVKFVPNSCSHISFLNFALIVMGGLGVTGLVLTHISSEFLILTLFGTEFSHSIQILNDLSVMYPILAINSVLGLKYLVPLGKEKQLNIVLFLASLLCIILLLVVYLFQGNNNYYYPVVISEYFISFLLLALFFYYKRKAV